MVRVTVVLWDSEPDVAVTVIVAVPTGVALGFVVATLLATQPAQPRPANRNTVARAT